MTYETRQAYAEICTVLQYMPDEYVKKIPERIIKLFQTEKLENYEVNINKSNPLDKNYLSRETMVIIAMLNYQYWCPNQKVKKDLNKIYNSNNEKYQKEIEERYNTDNLFKNRRTEEKEVKEESQALVEYKEKTFIQRIFDKIKRIFKRCQ